MVENVIQCIKCGKKLNIGSVTLSLWSPTTLMHIFHDCFRSQSTTSEMTLKLAAGIFPESVAWLTCLLKGTIPSFLSADNSCRAYKFDRWFWSPDWPVHQWISCPLLTVTFELWKGPVPREDNIFIILFLHNYNPNPPFYMVNDLELERIDHFEKNISNEYNVYHGQLMTSDDFMKLKANLGKLISMNLFLSTSVDSQVALTYAGDKATYPTMELVLFHIKIYISEGSNTYQHPFADISEDSQFQDEKEVLFFLTTIFRVEDI
ncbi:hypothetical protein I4U23_031359 [Adineta vaga]|nr:hypothetical protein I4U23_031359 [Adineta vaga]